MLIQCQSCATRFRIDPDRIPRRKTFVRCKSCGTPIYLDPALEGEEATEWADAGLIPAPDAEASAPGAAAAQAAPHAARGAGNGSGAADGIVVQCPQCDSRYRVPRAPLQRPRIKLKCSVCGYLFAPPQDAAAAGTAAEEVDTFFGGAGAPAMPSPRPTMPAGGGVGLDEVAAERLHEAPAPESFAPPEAVRDSEQAYLDAVSLDHEDKSFPPARKVPDEEKYRLFLQPDAFKPGGPFEEEAIQPSAAPGAPEVEAAVPPGGMVPGEELTPGAEAALPPLEEMPLPPLEGDLTLGALEPVPPLEPSAEAAAPAATMPGEVAPETPGGPPPGLEDDLPPLDPDTDAAPSPEELALDGLSLPDLGKPAERAAQPGADETGFDMGALPKEAFEQPEPAGYEPPPPPPPGGEMVPVAAAEGKQGPQPDEKTIERALAPGQVGWLSERRRFLVLAVLAGILVGVIIGWGGWLTERPDATRPFTFESGRANRLVLDESLDARTVIQRNGKRLFVVEGRVVNRFPKSVKVSWVRLRGRLYEDSNQSQLIGSAQAYAGNVLTQEQLEAWDAQAIAAYGAFNNGRNNVNFEIPPGRAVAFQLVFMDVREPVQRTIAEVISYVRDGVTVYVDLPGGG